MLLIRSWPHRTRPASVSVLANGSIPGSDQPIRVAPGRAPDQLLIILEALAAVTEFATGSIELLMHRESRRLPWAASFVLVTGIVTDETMIGLTRLRKAGRRVTLISLEKEAPPDDVEGILTYHVPGGLALFQRDKSTGTPGENDFRDHDTQTAQTIELRATG